MPVLSENVHMHNDEFLYFFKLTFFYIFRIGVLCLCSELFIVYSNGGTNGMVNAGHFSLYQSIKF